LPRTRRHWEPGDEWCEQQVIDQILEVRGSGRARHVARERDLTNNDQIVLGTAVWSDYDGDVIYGDYTAEWVEVEPGMWELEVEDRTAYLPGIGQLDNATGNVMYYHGDQIGSLRAVTTCAVGAGECIPGETASVLQRPVYTAFGELVYDLAPVDTHIRYRYAGEWGYEGRLGTETNGGGDAASGLPFIHVGHRWYDPSTGRFLQRDPIGIQGGWNTYEYVGSQPVRTFDPAGLTDPVDDFDAIVDAAGQQGWGGATKRLDSAFTQASCNAKITIKKAQEAFRRNKQFRKWVHTCYKPKMRTPGAGLRNPDLSEEDMLDAYTEWLELGKPKPC